MKKIYVMLLRIYCDYIEKIEEEWILVLQRMVYQEDYEQLIQIRNFSNWKKSFISTNIFVAREG